MSASRMPTLAPSAASASARLTAVVLLPTPPLPDATATMFFTFGSSWTPRCTACGIAELDVEGDVAALDAHVLELPGGDEVAAGFGVDHGLQGAQQVGLGNGHGVGRRERGSGSV